MTKRIFKYSSIVLVSSLFLLGCAEEEEKPYSLSEESTTGLTVIPTKLEFEGKGLSAKRIELRFNPDELTLVGIPEGEGFVWTANDLFVIEPEFNAQTCTQEIAKRRKCEIQIIYNSKTTKKINYNETVNVYANKDANQPGVTADPADPKPADSGYITLRFFYNNKPDIDYKDQKIVFGIKK